MPTATKVKLRPLHDRILVKRIEETEDRHGSIIIPDTAKEKPQEAKVIAVGNGKMTDEGKRLPDGRQGGRPHPVRQVLRQRGEDRRRGVPHPVEEDVLGILD